MFYRMFYDDALPQVFTTLGNLGPYIHKEIKLLQHMQEFTQIRQKTILIMKVFKLLFSEDISLFSAGNMS